MRKLFLNFNLFLFRLQLVIVFLIILEDHPLKKNNI